MVARNPIEMIVRSVAYARSVSATPPPPSSEPETTPEEFRQRALLFADLGRYDDAADEVAAGLAAAPTDAALLATLARVHLAADQPAEALVAADSSSECNSSRARRQFAQIKKGTGRPSGPSMTSTVDRGCFGR